MLSLQEHLGYDEIEIKVDAYLAENNPIDALLLLKRRLDICSDMDEICNLMLLQAWIYYKLYQYYDISMSYIQVILEQYQNKIKNKILLKCYYIKSLIHFQRGEYMLCHQTIVDVLSIDRDNQEAKTMMEIIQSRIRID